MMQENIRLPEDFTDKVMHRIEVREKAAAHRARTIAVAGGILGGAFLTAVTVFALHHYGIGLNFNIGTGYSADILSHINGFFSRISAAMHGAFDIPAGPTVSICLAVFILAIAGLWHDHCNSRHDYRKTIRYSGNPENGTL